MLADQALHKWTEHLVLNATGPWTSAGVLFGLLLSALLASLAVRKIATMLLTLRAVALAPTVSRRLSEWVKSLDYSDQEVLGADGAGELWVQRRKEAIDRLAGFFQNHWAKSIAWGNEVREASLTCVLRMRTGFPSRSCG